ncbi:MAG: TraM recognition domain-containing protein [Alphaproteobacteria bacterium]
MALDQKKYEHEHKAILRDVRPLGRRIADTMAQPSYSSTVFIMAAGGIYFVPWMTIFADVVLILCLLFFIWLRSIDRSLAFKLPMSAAKRKYKDNNNIGPGRSGKPEGVLYAGNVGNTNEEVWFTDSDIRTHILYLGTTGAGKTEGLKSLVSNALTWGSGFVYVDGKADTDLWSSLSAMLRRFGRDDDLLVLNYMTGNSSVQAPSNTMNPFSSGSASYLTNMLVSLMPESQGDNAMWSERAISLVSAIMPALCWKRDNQDVPLSVTILRDSLSLPAVVRLARDDAVPEDLRAGLKGYLDTLPGFNHDAYDDQGNVKPPDGSGPPPDTQTASQQHGYLAMQFTRSLQSLGDDYGYIFDTQAADVDMVDVVLNRRVLVVLIPALEKSTDEIANLGKIVSATIKGMMGSTLGSTVEGESEKVIENKPTKSSTPFITVFDEVGYYTAKGMAVMAAQARSLGFCLVFAGQDLPAMKKLVREEAQSITANCNIKIFGKLEDPTETKEFFEKTVGQAIVTEVSGFQMTGGSEFGSYFDTQQAGVQLRPRASYDELRGFKEGEAVVTFGEAVVDCKIFYCNPGMAKAMRVTRFLTLPPPDEAIIKHASTITKMRDLMVNKTWTAERADVAVETPPEIDALNEGFAEVEEKVETLVDAAIASIVHVHKLENSIDDVPAAAGGGTTGGGAQPAAKAPLPPAGQKPQSQPTAPQVPPQSPLAQKPNTAPPSTAPQANTTGQQQSSPVSPFAKKPADGQNAAPPSAPPPAGKKEAPMSFFSKNDTPASGNTAPPATPPQPEQQPAVKPPAASGQPAAQTPPPAQSEPAKAERKKLPPEIESIITSAAKDTKKALFNDPEDIDSAE